MRAFIGIEFPREIKSKIIEIQNYIKSISIAGRWKYIDNFHLTIKFLGEVSYEQVQNIYDNMKNSMGDQRSFYLNTGDIGYFKGNGCYRVIYLKIENDANILSNIFRSVENSCTDAGISPEKRKFTPHVTIAQDVKLACNFDDLYKHNQSENIKIPVNQISIIMSEQRDNKRIYTPIKTYRLTGES